MKFKAYIATKKLFDYFKSQMDEFKVVRRTNREIMEALGTNGKSRRTRHKLERRIQRLEKNGYLKVFKEDRRGGTLRTIKLLDPERPLVIKYD